MERKLPAGYRLYFTLLGALAVLCIAAGAVWAAQKQLQPSPTPAAQYLLKDHAGHVALYAADGAGPLAEYEIYTRLLPEADVQALSTGVPVENDAALQRILEDYGL